MHVCLVYKTKMERTIYMKTKRRLDVRTRYRHACTFTHTHTHYAGYSAAQSHDAFAPQSIMMHLHGCWHESWGMHMHIMCAYVTRAYVHMHIDTHCWCRCNAGFVNTSEWIRNQTVKANASGTNFSAPNVSVLCLDVDECASKSHNCHPDAHCINTPGNFTCR
jgi:hypothetical protein